MRVLLVGLLVAVALAGCSPAGGGPGSSGPVLTPEETAADPAIAYGVAPDDPSAPREDTLGRSPDAAVMELIDALGERDWTKAYSLYATPTPNVEMAAKDWADANETYTGFTIHETRVADSERAWVRVTYMVTTSRADSSPYSGTVNEPGEWWPLHKVDGTWKVGWMPRQ